MIISNIHYFSYQISSDKNKFGCLLQISINTVWYNRCHMESGIGNNQINSSSLETSPEELRRQRWTIFGIIVGIIILIAIFVTSMVFLLHPGLTSTDTVTRIRDVFIIFMALESLLIGLVLVILIIQLARLTNLIQNEIKPILDSTNETVSNLRGTTTFLSHNLVEPVIKLNEYLAVITRFTEIIGLKKR